LLKYSFWYCSPVFFFLVICHMVQGQLLRLRGQASLRTFKKLKWGRCWEPTGVSNKLCVLSLAQPQTAEGSKYSYAQ
jgi:hypothetical protein